MIQYCWPATVRVLQLALEIMEGEFGDYTNLKTLQKELNPAKNFDLRVTGC